MKNKLFIFAAIFGALFNKISKAQNLEWVNSLGNSEFEKGTSIAIDNSGNYYYTGSFEGTIDLDPSSATYDLTSVGLTDIFVAKYSSSGNFLWAFSLSSYQNLTSQSQWDDESTVIYTDENGNTYLAGNMGGARANFDPHGNQVLFPAHSFLAKYNTNGAFEWAIEVDGSLFRTSDVAVDNAGNIFLIGSDSGSGRVEIYKYNSAGNLIWSIQDGLSNDTPHGNAITLDDNGNFYVTGTLDNQQWLQITSGQMFLAKLDSSGSFLKGYGFNITEGMDLVYHDNHLYVVGNGEGDFDPLPPVASITGKSFVAKYTADLDYVWARGFDGVCASGCINAKDIDIDYQGNVILSGNFNDTVDFNTGFPTGEIGATSNDNGFLAFFNKDGNFLEAYNLASTSDVSIEDLKVDDDGSVFITGEYSGVTDFDLLTGATNLTAAGETDIFLAKYSNSWVGISVPQKLVNYQVSPNPSLGYFTVQIQASTQEEIQVSVLNILGQAVFKTPVENVVGEYTKPIELANTSAGVYFVRVKVGEVYASQKIIMQ